MAALSVSPLSRMNFSRVSRSGRPFAKRVDFGILERAIRRA